jgi:hypothetical protein
LRDRWYIFVPIIKTEIRAIPLRPVWEREVEKIKQKLIAALANILPACSDAMLQKTLIKFKA